MSSFYIVNIVLLVIAIFNFIHALKELRSLQKGDVLLVTACVIRFVTE